MDIFQMAITKLASLFFIAALGYFLGKKRFVPENTAGTLAKLEMFLFLPALAFQSFAANCRWQALAENAALPLLAVFILAVTVAAGIPLSRFFSRDRRERAVYTYSLVIPNLGYMGYPMVAAAFGETALFHMMLFTIPFNVMIYSWGIYILDPSPEKRFSLKTLIANPPLLATASGILWGLSNAPMPAFAGDIVSSTAACMAPCAMLITGLVLSEKPLKQLFGGVHIFVTAILRLAVIPVAAGAVLYGCGVRGDLALIPVAVLAMPTGLNSVVFPEARGGKGGLGARLCFVTSCLGLITIPLIFGILSVFF